MMRKIFLSITTLFSLLKIFNYKNKIERSVVFIDQFYKHKGRYGNYKVKFLGKLISTPWLPMLRVQLRSFFLHKEYNFELSKNPLILDAGANLGVGVIYFSKQYEDCKIIAIEADPNLFENYLKKNINNFNLQNQSVLINKALWSSNEVLKFNSTGLDSGSISSNGNISVQTITLDEIIKKYGKIDFLKLDIEGAELEVLKHSRLLNQVKNIYIEMEMGLDQDYENEILKILKENSFKYYIRSTTKYNTPEEMFNSKEDITYYCHIFAKQTK